MNVLKICFHSITSFEVSTHNLCQHYCYLFGLRVYGIQSGVNPRTPLIEPGQLIVYSVAVFTPEYKKTFLHDVTKQADSEGKKRCIKQFVYNYVIYMLKYQNNIISLIFFQIFRKIF